MQAGYYIRRGSKLERIAGLRRLVRHWGRWGEEECLRLLRIIKEVEGGRSSRIVNRLRLLE
jgi:hypothetical protein